MTLHIDVDSDMSLEVVHLVVRSTVGMNSTLHWTDGNHMQYITIHHSVHPSGVQWSSAEFSGVQRSSVEFGGVQRSSAEFSGVQRSSVDTICRVRAAHRLPLALDR